jgi:hypothetical protein
MNLIHSKGRPRPDAIKASPYGRDTTAGRRSSYLPVSWPAAPPAPIGCSRSSGPRRKDVVMGRHFPTPRGQGRVVSDRLDPS